ncbi:TerB family tellurite resistance protein [Yoonia sp. 2307UL14-13]|uniref:TerB family tellurite resistance protein n=1 Tax=Yoonia sp. 2307UL14-13 TaxID=3126506 RepID=UPI003097B305
MKHLLIALLMLFGMVGPVHALTLEDVRDFSISEFYADLLVNDLEFVAPTKIPSDNDGFMSLCYRTRGIQIWGYQLTADIQGYVLASDGCRGTAGAEMRPFSTEQMITAQSTPLNLIDPSIPAEAANDLDRNLRNYGFPIAFALILVAIIINRLRSLLSLNPNAPMRKKAANRILTALCHAAKCDGLVSSREIKLIGRTMQRMTKQNYAANEIMRISDRAKLNLSLQDYINFGKGLRDREKDMMLQGVLYITMAGDRMLPAEYEFVTSLAHGLGMPAEDFRRVLYQAFEDKEINPS